MAVLVYMGGVLSILYYYGLTQRIAAKTAWLMQVSLGTTAIETLGVASNIFLNGVSPLKVNKKQSSCVLIAFNVDGHDSDASIVLTPPHSVRVPHLPRRWSRHHCRFHLRPPHSLRCKRQLTALSPTRMVIIDGKL